MLGGPLRWLVRVIVLGLAVGAPLWAFANERDVKLDVEGDVKVVKTYATTPNELLERHGVDQAKDDSISGSPALADGGTVEFRRAKPLRLILDGEPRKVVAHGLTVGDALKDLGLVPGPKDHVSPAPETKLTRNMEIFVRNAVHTTLRVDGRTRDVVTSADTVSNLLKHAGVTLDADDYVVPARGVEPTDGMAVRVVRVRKLTQERSVRIPFRYVTHKDPEMESGVRKVVQQGAEGLKTQHFAVVLEDGVRVSNRLIDEEVVRDSRNHIVNVGTKEPTFKGSGGSQSGVASWFAADGLVAAHRSLPIGTVVKVTNVENGKSVSVKINQRGPYVDGRVIDLSDDAFERLAPLGKGTIKVKVAS